MVYEGFQLDLGSYTTPYEDACKTNAASPTCTQYVTGKLSAISTEAMSRKQNTFDKTYIDLQRTMDMDHNATSYGIRNQDMLTMKKFISDYNNQIQTDTDYNESMSKRQFEINEYFYYNKLDTLFFLQVFFIVGLIMAMVLYGNRVGYLSTRQAGMATLILTLLVVIVGVTRYFYTTRTRDHRLWHRRYFGSEEDDKGPLLKCPDTAPGPAGSPLPAITVDLNAIFAKNTTQCGSDAYKKTKKWVKELNDETIKFQQATSDKPLDLGLLPESCSA